MTMHLLRGMTTINYGKTNYKLTAKQRKARDKALAEQRKLKPQTYSGKQKLIGIAMMHKSNLVPVFSTKDAKEISKMRRG